MQRSFISALPYYVRGIMWSSTCHQIGVHREPYAYLWFAPLPSEMHPGSGPRRLSLARRQKGSISYYKQLIMSTGQILIGQNADQKQALSLAHQRRAHQGVGHHGDHQLKGSASGIARDA